jgi:hypothetical protein
VGIAGTETVTVSMIMTGTSPDGRVEIEGWACVDSKTGPRSVAGAGRVEIPRSARGMSIGRRRSLQEEWLYSWTGKEGMVEMYLRNRHVAGRVGKPGVVDRGAFE